MIDPVDLKSISKALHAMYSISGLADTFDELVSEFEKLKAERGYDEQWAVVHGFDPHLALVTEAREFLGGEPFVNNAYRPFDQKFRIRHWEKNNARIPLKLPGELNDFFADVGNWEDAHGHDVRQKCYPEYQCRAIEGYAQSLIHRLVAALTGDNLEVRND